MALMGLHTPGGGHADEQAVAVAVIVLIGQTGTCQFAVECTAHGRDIWVTVRVIKDVYICIFVAFATAKGQGNE